MTTLALLAVTVPVSTGLVSHGAAPGVTVALDADPSGNGPRTVGSIEQDVYATVGQPVDIDIVIPSPGIPADRGIAAYQFNLYYDPDLVWIDADDVLLLGQAPGSSVIPIQDPKPDKNGFYISWGVDFGAKGIEPGGASETGPGVITRITLLPQSSGLSNLTLRDVVIIDDASQRISVDSVQSGTITVSPAATVAPAVATPTPTSPVLPFPAAGGGPSAGGGVSWWFIVAGLVAALGGASLLIGGGLAFSGRGRRPAPSVKDRRRRSPDEG
jgi:hypothetical protein